MNDKFLFGLICGMLGGAVLVTNSVKARQMVKDGQDQVMQKVNDSVKQNKKNEN